jgi:tRNA threonylcarbamoyladenosine dehydratase
MEGEKGAIRMNEAEYIGGMLTRTRLYFDEESVDKVRNSVFAVSGLGGVGAITAELLARWGVKRFRLLDMDRYEPSNLNRQLFATSKTLGRYKVDVTSERIQEINPFAEIEMAIHERVDNENVHRFVKGADIVIQNADHPSCKLFYLAARQHQVPLVNGYATVTGGRVQAFDYRKSECKSIFEEWWNKFKFGDMKPLEEMDQAEIRKFDRQNVHATAPSLNFVTNMVGCLIVGEAIKLVMDINSRINYPRYLEFDTFKTIYSRRNANSIFNISNLKRLFSVIGAKSKERERKL